MVLVDTLNTPGNKFFFIILKALSLPSRNLVHTPGKTYIQGDPNVPNVRVLLQEQVVRTNGKILRGRHYLTNNEGHVL